MKIRKVLIVYKKSSYQDHALDRKDANFLRLLKERNIAIRRSKNTHDIHQNTFETVKAHLKALGIPFDVRLRYHLKTARGYDLILTIGGDGTFLDTSHFLKGGVLLGINSVPEESVGFFCRATADNFLEKIYVFLQGRAKLQTLHRLRITIDGKKRGAMALNDILFANRNPAGTTRYLLRAGSRREEQKSSGLWISPAAGSTAATKSAGGRPLPLGSAKMQLVVREPYEPPGRKYLLKRVVLGPRQRLTILPMMDDAALFIDGPHFTFPVRRGCTIVIQNAWEPIRVLW